MFNLYGISLFGQATFQGLHSHMWLVAVILDGTAIENPPEKNLEEHCDGPPGPEKAAGTDGAVLSICHSSHDAFQSWTLRPHDPKRFRNTTGGKASGGCYFIVLITKSPKQSQKVASKPAS